MNRFASPVELPYGMEAEGGRGQLKAAIAEALAQLPTGHAHITVAGVIRALLDQVKTLKAKA